TRQHENLTQLQVETRFHRLLLRNTYGTFPQLSHKPAGEARATYHFEQEFQYLDMAPGFVYVPSPGVKSVPAQQEPVRVRALVERFFHLEREFVHVLRIVQDRQPLSMLVRAHTGQTFEHLVACNLDPAVIDQQG